MVNAVFSSFNPFLEQSEKIIIDFNNSEVIKLLDYAELIEFFSSLEEALKRYDQLLARGYPRSAAFMMNIIIKGANHSVGDDSVNKIITENLSGLSDDEMATPARDLILKITNPSAKKKILFSSAHWLTGGMERVMSTLFTQLNDEYEIYLITPYDSTKSYIDIPGYITNIKVDTELFKFHFDSLILSYALLLDIDVVIGLMNMFDKQLNLYNLCKGTKIRTIASNHEYYFYPYKSKEHYEVVEKRLSAFKNCSAVIWPNNFNAALCGLYVENSYVIGNPNNFEIIPSKKRSTENTVLCVGRFNDYVKRIDRIIESFSLVLQKVPDAKLLLVGKYDMDALIGNQKERVTIAGLLQKFSIPASSIKFVGEVNNVQDYYSSAKVLMLTSNSEGFGMVLNEAACFGVPSVVNYIPGIEDIIVDGENGYITEQGDIVSLASRVCDILQSDDLHKKLSNNAKKKVSEFDAKHIGNVWKFLINSLIEAQEESFLHTKLNSKIGYIEPDGQLKKILAKELNEIFYLSIANKNYKILTGRKLLVAKVVNMPRRIRNNIEYEGLTKTSKKIIGRSYRIVKKRVPKRK